MPWKSYLTIFKAESPVHIGYKQIGILKTTRYYITGRVMWGAITSKLTRALFNNPDAKDYRAVGNFVRENIRTTYFYPAIEGNKVENPEEWSKYVVDNYLVFLPEYTEEGLKFGSKSKEEFEGIFIDSFVSTALDAKTKTAEEGSLHEFEYVRDKVPIPNSVIQVYWLGYVFVNVNQNIVVKDNKGEAINAKVLGESNDIKITLKNSELVSLKDALDQLFVGGERNYGFGRLKSKNDHMYEIGNKLFGRFEFETNSKEIKIKTCMAISHVESDEINLKLGEIEPLVGLEWSEKGAGQRISEAMICFTPGSKLDVELLKLRDYGILSKT